MLENIRALVAHPAHLQQLQLLPYLPQCVTTWRWAVEPLDDAAVNLLYLRYIYASKYVICCLPLYFTCASSFAHWRFVVILISLHVQPSVGLVITLGHPVRLIVHGVVTSLHSPFAVAPQSASPSHEDCNQWRSLAARTASRSTGSCRRCRASSAASALWYSSS